MIATQERCTFCRDHSCPECKKCDSCSCSENGHYHNDAGQIKCAICDSRCFGIYR